MSFTPVVLSLSAEPVSAQNFIEQLWRRFTSRSRRDERPATISSGGANRDRCPYTAQELVAFVPVSEEAGSPYIEKTVSANPTWYFYVPYQPERGRLVEFVLLDANENILYQNIFPLSDTPGVLGVSLPENGAGLEVNQTYRWVFSVVCNANNRSGDATVNGWIERVPSGTLSFNPEKVGDQERYLLYANSLIWFDAVDGIANLKIKYPENPEINEAWDGLLESFGLRNLPDNISIIH